MFLFQVEGVTGQKFEGTTQAFSNPAYNMVRIHTSLLKVKEIYVFTGTVRLYNISVLEGDQLINLVNNSQYYFEKKTERII